MSSTTGERQIRIPHNVPAGLDRKPVGRHRRDQVGIKTRMLTAAELANLQQQLDPEVVAASAPVPAVVPVDPPMGAWARIRHNLGKFR